MRLQKKQLLRQLKILELLDTNLVNAQQARRVLR